MDHFAQHHEAADLLATATQQVAASVQAVRMLYLRKACPATVRGKGQELLKLIQAALQLAAAAEHACLTILDQPKTDKQKPIRKSSRRNR